MPLTLSAVRPASVRAMFSASAWAMYSSEPALPAMPAAPFLFLAGGYGSSLSFSTASTAITS